MAALSYAWNLYATVAATLTNGIDPRLEKIPFR